MVHQMFCQKRTLLMAMQQNFNIFTNSSSKSKSQRNKNLRLAKKWVYFEN